MKERIKVLVVDDSALVRQTMQQILETDSRIEVVATAMDPFVAVRKMNQVMPDVMILDVEMPRMDGITFLRKIMDHDPVPVVMCSSFTERGSDAAFKALEGGAVDIIGKPRLGTKLFLEESRVRICDVVKAASLVRVRRRTEQQRKIEPKRTADAVIPIVRGGPVIRTAQQVVVVGASTGGTEALRKFLEHLRPSAPGIVIALHMPEQFTAAFAKRLDGLCGVNVREAEDNDAVVPGLALLAPGNRHTLLKRIGARYFVEVRDGPLVSRHRPSVDVLFRSAARYAGRNAVGVIMTGMGDDGAQGMKEMRDAGACTIAQNAATCVVYGMPLEAVKRGGVEKVLPLEGIAPEVLRVCE